MSTITEVRERDRRVGAAARRHPEGQGRVRVLVGHVGRRDAVGRDAALAASPRAHPRDRDRGRAGGAGRVRRAHARRTCRGARRTGSSTTTSRCWRSTRSATRASRWRSSPPTIPRRRATRPSKIEVAYEELEPLVDPEFALSPDSPPLHPGGNLLRHVYIEHGDGAGRGRRRGVRRVRGRDAGPGVPRAGVRAGDPEPRTAASSCSSPPSGCTWTATRWPRRWTCRWRRCASRWPASAARSAGARTCRCRPTPACSRCTPASR